MNLSKEELAFRDEVRHTGQSSGVAAAGRPGNTTFLPARWRRPMPPRSRPWVW
jgi:hypothetical protein